MKTQPDGSRTEEAIRILTRGGIVIFPTDTAFGMGCRIDMPESVDRLFEIRRRPRTQATPVLVGSADQALSYLESPSDIVRRLMKTHWPGGLTIIGRVKGHSVYSPILGGTDKIGLRQPDHPITLALIRGAGIPVIGTSANFHGEPTPYAFSDLDPGLVRLVDYVLEGTCHAGNVSTVIDTTTTPVTVRRQGAVTLKPEELV